MTSFHIAVNERRKIIKSECSNFYHDDDHSDASESCGLPTWPNPMNHFEKRKMTQRTELKHANNLQKTNIKNIKTTFSSCLIFKQVIGSHVFHKEQKKNSKLTSVRIGLGTKQSRRDVTSKPKISGQLRRRS